VRVLHGISLEVREGEVVVVLGANGAGKTTTMRAICGLVDTAGSIRLGGQELVGKKSADVARLGVAHVPQGRGTFADLSVEDNLQLGAFVRKDKEIRSDIDRWYDVFPVLGERREQMAGTLSGGEQQMLAVARALMGRPRLLLLDEPSLGLAPMIVQDVFKNLQSIRPSSAPPCSSSSRTPTSLSASPTAATSSKPARSCSAAPPRSCRATTPCEPPTSGSDLVPTAPPRPPQES
jgi:branched-chain amino acid transport system ATP-binding protein